MKQNYQDVAKGAIGFTTKKRTEVRVIRVTTGPTQMMLGACKYRSEDRSEGNRNSHQIM